MPHNFSIPTDVEIENLVTRVFESMPDADQSKLLLIENRLLQKARRNKPQKKLNKIPWWFVLILTGGFATAAWWAGDLFMDKQNMEMIDIQSGSSDKIVQPEPDKKKTGSNTQKIIQDNELNHKNKSPIIYQRESF